MIELIQELIDKGLAYPSGGDVYYSVARFKGYGKLSGRKLEDMRAGARIEINEQKRDPMDFVLWKSSKPGEPTWDSPWGPGRPGWHIECSAMSRKYLGNTFDIHGGGKDLIFPHHENELAQSEGATGVPFVNMWVHHGFVTIRDEKMSKSLGNFLTIRDILKHYHPEVLRFFIFSTQYRNPLDFSETAMQNAMIGLDRMYECVAAIDSLTGDGPENLDSVISEKDMDKLAAIEKRFQDGMDNDFNTAQAQGVLFDMVKLLNKIRRQLPANPAAADIALLKDSVTMLKKLAGIMGLLAEDADTYLKKKKNLLLDGLDIDEETITKMIGQRLEARNAKDWTQSDAIRDKLLEKNIILKDGPDGTSWEIKRQK